MKCKINMPNPQKYYFLLLDDFTLWCSIIIKTILHEYVLSMLRVGKKEINIEPTHLLKHTVALELIFVLGI